MITTGQKKRILYSLVSLSASNYRLHTPSFFSRRTCPDLHSGVCYFIEFDARYLTSPSVRFLDDLIWSAEVFWAQAFCSFAFK